MVKRMFLLAVLALSCSLTASFAGEKPKAALIFKSAGNAFGEKMMEGFKTAVEEKGGECVLRAPDQPTAEAQAAIIEELMTQGVAVIALSANDPDALRPVLKKARRAGIRVITVDSPINAQSRDVHINQVDSELIGLMLVQAAYEMSGGKGDVAILSATSRAANQNAWIERMKKAAEDEKYKDMKIVAVAYGDDLRDKSISETEALLEAHPDLKVIIAPTTVGIAAAGKALTDKKLRDKVYLTGLGLPSEMAEYIENGVCPWMYLWNPMDLGYLAGYIASEMIEGSMSGTRGEYINAGRLGARIVVSAPDEGTEIMLGAPFRFDKSNIDEWKKVY